MRSLMTVLLLGGAAASLGAQATVTIDPGMSRDQVVAKLGEPLSVRSYDGHTYLLYKNGCEKTCGMNDLVTLDSGKVVDAVFRAPGRRFSGTSSSPRMISQAEAKHGNGTGPLAIPAGEAKPAKPKAVESAPVKTAPATKAVTAPPKTQGNAAAKSASPPPPPKKTDAAPAKTAAPAPPSKKADAAAPTKSTTAPAKTDAAPATKTEPPKKPDPKKPPTATEG
jgi:hypothetical protein